MLLFAVLACNSGDAPVPTPEAPAYYGNVRSVLDGSCVTCHYPGGSTPFALDTYAAAAPLAGAIAAAVESGEMPPWKPSPDCRSYEGERLLAGDDIAALRAWADAGAPEGTPDGVPPVQVSTAVLADATHTESIPGYLPDLSVADDYRCFILSELGLEDGGFLTGSGVVPGSSPVHHVLVYAYPDSNRGAMEAADAEDAAAGYACAGSGLPTSSTVSTEPPPGVGALLEGLIPEGFGGGAPNQLAGWVPGSGGMELDEGLAIVVDPGSVIIAQIHYSRSGGDAVTDATEIRLRVTDQAPTQAIRTTALLVHDLDIPAGSENVVFSSQVPYYGAAPLDIRSVAGHMHQLGTRISAREIGGDDECLLDIPEWDFHWQGGYEPTVPISVASGSRLELTCEYDNSATNQPYVGGTQSAPMDVYWGESSTDEMCLMYLSRVAPYVPPPAEDEPACASVATCVDACPESDWGCTTGCTATVPACGACVSSAIQACAPACLVLLAAEPECAADCIMSAALLGGSLSLCLEGECPEVAASFDACVSTAAADDPACTDALTECGL